MEQVSKVEWRVLIHSTAGKHTHELGESVLNSVLDQGQAREVKYRYAKWGSSGGNRNQNWKRTNSERQCAQGQDDVQHMTD